MPRLIASTAEHVTKLAPLTDEEVRACEAVFAVQFPAALVDLLKEQNGGYFENSDFKLNGRDYSIAGVMGISGVADWGAIRPLSEIFDSDSFDESQLQQFREMIGDPAKVFPFDGDGHYYYALDYNRPNSQGEPTVAYLNIEGEIVRRRVADSFVELLAGQYEGDPEPTVSMAEADRFDLIAEGGYSGSRPNVPQPLLHSWKICGAADRIVVLASENFGFGPTLQRYELKVSALALEPMTADEVSESLGAELSDLLLPALTTPLIEDWGDDEVSPTCYQLRLPIDPQKEWVRIHRSEPYQGKWKNTSTEIVYAMVHSGSRDQLQRALQSVIRYLS